MSQSDRTPLPGDAQAQRDAALARTALRLLEPDRLPDPGQTRAALARVPRPQAHVVPPLPPATRAARARFSPRRLQTATAVVAFALLGGVVATPAGRSFAADLLAQFRSERFAVVTIDPAANRQALTELARIGTVEDGFGAATSPQAVAGVGQASQRVGFPVTQPDPAVLPPGVDRTPQVAVTRAARVRITFDAARARGYLDAHGSRLAVPAGIDGATLVVEVPAAAVLQYPGDGPGPGLVIGQTRAVTARVHGDMTLAQLRGFLLDLPGLSPELVNQLRAINDWRTTLPLPIPADELDSAETTVDGAPAVAVTDPSGLGSGLIWQRDGRIYGVGGTVGLDEVRRVAEHLD